MKAKKNPNKKTKVIRWVGNPTPGQMQQGIKNKGKTLESLSNSTLEFSLKLLMENLINLNSLWYMINLVSER